MKKSLLIILSLCLMYFSVTAQTGSTSLVTIGPDGRLKYAPDVNGNIIPDYSNVGYKNSEASIPNVPVVKTISAVSGDNTSNIQNAINAMASLPLNNGIRGALLLKAGTYNINNTIHINSSGIVLRGEGNSTILMATKTSQYDLISISGSGSATAVGSTSQKIQGSYIPVGVKTFTLPAGHGFVKGDDVMLQRKPNQAWINMLGMNVLSQIPCDDGGCNVDWTPAAYTVNYIRKVIDVSGNVVTLDAPNVDVIDSKYAEGFIMKYTWSGKIENVGVESIYFDSKYTNVNDENHGWNAVSFSKAKNCWVISIEAHHYGYSAVSVNESAAFVSVLNSKNIDPISQTIGGRKYSFNITGQRNLVKNCSTNGGRHDYVTGSQTAGPNTFVNSTSVNPHADIGPHQRWATGILFDALTGTGEMNAQNRLGYGTGHGWSGAQVLYWNCSASKFIVQSPPNHMNWVIGCKGTVTDVGDLFTGDPCIHQSTGNFIKDIPSLYEKQLSDRLNASNICLAAVASADDGNIATNVLDGDLTTRWAANGDGQWIQFCLGALKGISGVQIAFYNGNVRTSKFDILVSQDGNSWTNVGTNLQSSGTTLALETFNFSIQKGKYVKIVGHGNSVNTWTSLTEVKITSQDIVNKLPTVSITNPTNNASFVAPATVIIAANAADTDGSVTKVEFYNGTTLVATDNSAPFSYTWTGVNAGNYTITAKATDDMNASVTSSSVNIKVTAACIPAFASSDDGNVAVNVLDNDLNTRWSANGDGQWIQFCMDSVITIKGVQIAFYNGNARQSTIDVLFSNDGISWSNALTGAKSSGTTLNLETFSFNVQNGKFLRIVGHGNSVNTWNSFTEVKVLKDVQTVNQSPVVSLTSPANNASFNAPANISISANASDADGSVSKVEFYNGVNLLGTSTAAPYTFTWTNVSEGDYTITAKATDNSNASTTSGSVTVHVIKPAPVCLPASASSDDGNVATNVLDNNLSTRWSANGDGQWIQFCLDSITEVNTVQIAFYNGNVRQSTFDILISLDGTNWSNVLTSVKSSGTTLNLETFAITKQNAKHVRIVGHGNSVNTWNSFTEVKILSNVQTINQKPVVSLTSPSNNASFNAPASITISANASDTDGSVNMVEFYNGSTLLSTDNTSPYSYTWSNVAAGTYTITAKATDNSGASVTSAAVTVKVNTVTTNTCSGIAQYVENGGYVAGSKVQNAGGLYQCKPYPYSGWCNGSAWAYAPGTGSYWQDAWTFVSTCSSAKLSSSAISENEGISPNPASGANSVTIKIISDFSGSEKVTVISSTGQVVNIEDIVLQTGENQIPMSISNLDQGLYLIKVGEKTFRLVKSN